MHAELWKTQDFKPLTLIFVSSLVSLQHAFASSSPLLFSSFFPLLLFFSTESLIHAYAQCPVPKPTTPSSHFQSDLFFFFPSFLRSTPSVPFPILCRFQFRFL